MYNIDNINWEQLAHVLKSYGYTKNVFFSKLENGTLPPALLQVI